MKTKQPHAAVWWTVAALVIWFVLADTPLLGHLYLFVIAVACLSIPMMGVVMLVRELWLRLAARWRRERLARFLRRELP